MIEQNNINEVVNNEHKQEESVLPEAEEKKENKPVRKSNAEALQEAKDEIKTTQEKIKELQGNKEKTEEEKAELKNLKAKLSVLKVEKAKLQKKVDNARNNAVIRAEGKKLAGLKQEAINKVLDAEGLNTENGVKGLIALRRVCLKYNVKGNKTLEKCLEYVKQNAPNLINND